MRWLSFIVFASLVASNALAADPAGSPDPGEDPGEGRAVEGRVLEGHRFVPFLILPTPFVTSRVAMQSTLGYAALVNADSGGFLGLSDPDATYTPLAQEFRVAVKATPWIGLEAAGVGSVILGTDVPGVFEFGATAGYGGSLGVLASGRFGPWQLAGRLDGERTHRAGIVPQAVENVDKLVTRGTSSIGGPSGAVALAVSESVGLQAGASFEGYVIDVEGAENIDGSELRGGVGLSLAFGPISLHLADSLGHQFGEDRPAGLYPLDDTWNEVEVGVYTTGDGRMDVGLAGVALVSKTERRLVGILSLSCYF